MTRALGRYELLRPLARGGMGEVYLARRRAAGVEKWLVVKRMRPEKSGDARFLDLFVREARLSMSLAHQNIVPVFDFGRIDDQVFLAMERVEGKDLGSSLAAAGRGLPPLLAAFVAAECCQALDYAHRRKGPDGTLLGIVHRDVTPRNVLLSWSGEVKLTDFGIAALAGDPTSKMVGTPAYMAPEQARGEPIDPRADVYSIGMVLREALTGKRPRPGGDRDSMLDFAKRGELEPWPEHLAGGLKAIVERATAMAKEDRYQDARAVLEALDEFIVAERVEHKGEGAPARQLAAWLADVWKDEREEGAIEDAIEGEELVSFLDDGALDVIGTGTQRSMVATAAEGDAVPHPIFTPQQMPAVRPPPSMPTPTSTTMPTPPSTNMPAAAMMLTPAAAPMTAAAPEPASKRRWLLGAGIAAIVAGGAAITWTTRSGGAEEPQAQPQPQAQLQSQPERQPEPVPTPSPPASPSPSPPPSPPPPPPPSPPPRPQVAKKQPPPPIVQPVVAPVVTHKVTIGSTPWSYWYVDDDPTKHEYIETISLAAGSHRIHYVGNEHLKVDKTVMIQVPDFDGFRYTEALGAP